MKLEIVILFSGTWICIGSESRMVGLSTHPRESAWCFRSTIECNPSFRRTLAAWIGPGLREPIHGQRNEQEKSGNSCKIQRICEISKKVSEQLFGL